MFAFIHKWHKKIGVSVALFVVFLVISGIALNHSDGLKLNTIHIKNNWLLDIYQIGPDKKPIAFQEGGHWISHVGERVYFNGSEIAKEVQQLFGVITINDIIIIAMDGRLTLLTQAGEVIEHVTGTEGVPAGMRAIGVSDNKVVIRAAHGIYRVDIEALEWEEFDDLPAVWSASEPLPDDMEESLLALYRGTGLSLERVLLDFHSGRILGVWGIYLIDLAAILFLLLALSGIWMWWKRR